MQIGLFDVYKKNDESNNSNANEELYYTEAKELFKEYGAVFIVNRVLL